MAGPKLCILVPMITTLVTAQTDLFPTVHGFEIRARGLIRNFTVVQ